MANNLSLKSNKVNLIFTSDKIDKKFIDDLYQYCNDNNWQFAFIIHDKDIKDTGELKTKHIHMVAILPKRQRLTTIIGGLSKELSFPLNLITIEKLNDLIGSVQYLIHKNDKEKYQYDISSIITNWTDKNEFETILTCENNALSFDRLVDIINNSYDLMEIIEKVGLTFYRLNRNVIIDIYRCIQERKRYKQYDTKGE